MSRHPRAAFIFAIAAACGLACSLASADDKAAPAIAAQVGVVNLKAGDVRLADLHNLLNDQALPAEARLLLQLDGPMTPDRSAALADLGVRLGDYWPTNCFVVEPGAATPAGLRGLGFVQGLFAIRPEWKIDPELGARLYATPERQALAAHGLRLAMVTLHRGESAAAASASINQTAGARLVHAELEDGSWTLLAELPAAAEGALAQLPSVAFIGDAPEITLRNNTVRWIVQSNRANQTPLYDHGLTGVGQVIGMIDGGLDPNHCSFYDPVNPIGPDHRKIVAYNSFVFPDFHGTHTSGTAAGDAGAFNDLRGIAYNARIAFNTYPSANETSVFNKFELHRTQGAFTHSNSWGNDSTTTYDSTCRGIDNFSWLHDDNLILFAVTNQSALKNPENAKNLLAVAASGDSGLQNNFCYGGRGPTIDGRRKPEVMAPGCGINSANAGTTCGVTALSGTSMACPSVTAIAALTREYFTRGYYPSGSANQADAFEPSGALLKACVVNSAVDMTGLPGFPGLNEGWGRILADNSLYFTGDATTLLVAQARNGQAGALTTGQSLQFRFRVRSSDAPVKVTMAFHDAPASLPVTLAPVNDLDLTVINSADTFLGNSFSGGFSRSGGSPDALNNLEQVLIASPTPGAWVARVSATAVNVGQQGYALVITGDAEWLCPADFNGDGFVDFFDIDEYVSAFESGNSLADINGDGFLDFFDYDAFVAFFDAGC